MFVLTSLVDFSVNTGGKIAHIGGALAGFIFAYYYRRGKDVTRGFDRMMDRVVTWFKPGTPHMRVSHKRSRPAREQKPPADDKAYKSEKANEQKEVDAILDKISKGGYDSLSKKEKEILFKQSK